MLLQSLKKFHQRLFKISRKQNVTDTLSFVRSVVRSVVRSDNVKTVYPPTNTVCGGYNDFKSQTSTFKRGLDINFDFV